MFWTPSEVFCPNIPTPTPPKGRSFHGRPDKTLLAQNSKIPNYNDFFTGQKGVIFQPRADSKTVSFSPFAFCCSDDLRGPGPGWIYFLGGGGCQLIPFWGREGVPNRGVDY